ncbi:phage tail tube protein [Rheinheimera sp. MM224]|uniref:phage tail tube protein n=1 Tax=Rheinheimera sp. MM224 TaxID=3019969 RepID=UPI0021F8266C|nr:phage tail tube protein [Rheinheimera sp. MM224]CAI3796036.1 hypothetical protein JAMGFMIE_01467 [Rheinheimera sp. MM224]
MAIRTQGTQLYTIDPENGLVLKVNCVTSIDGIDATIGDIVTSCLEAESNTYEPGMSEPGTVTFGVNPDPRDTSHFRLHALKTGKVVLPWAIGWSDGKDIEPEVATDSNGEYMFDLPEDRSWIVFEGFMNSFPFSFAANAVVASTVGIRISGGDPIPVPKSAS